MMEEHYFAVLFIILSHLKNLKHPWAVTGSLGLNLQGIQVDVHDIDLQSTKQGAFAIQEALSEYVVHKVAFLESKKIRSFFGELNINGIKVEIMGELQKRSSENGWESPNDLSEFIHWVNVEGRSIPVLDLEMEYQAYQRLGREEKAEKIRAALENRLGPGNLGD
jgi:hypothetical protein